MASRRIAQAALLTVILAVALMLAVSPAWARPYVWVDARADAVFDDAGRLHAVNIEWRFDKEYSETAISGLEADGNGNHPPEDLQKIAFRTLESLKASHFFLHVEVDEKAVGYADITEYGANVRDDVLSIYFTVPLAQAVDPGLSTVEFALYDPTFNVAIRLASEPPVEMLGSPPAGCRIAVMSSPSDDDTISGATGSDTDAPEFPQRVGELYARTMKIACPPRTIARSGRIESPTRIE